MPRPNLLILLLSLCAASAPIRAQECTPPPISVDSSIYNIFTPEQEMIFGELTYQQMSGELRFVRDPALEAYLRDIGAKLVKHLPPTGLKFQFFIVDLPDANAFNIPGGYVFVSRKLISFTNNEDELAGVMAHELGHATVRHAASDISELLKKVLNVKQLGDRKDVTEKYNLLIERERTKRISQDRNHENDQQLQADRIGLFAMVAAGYDPNSFGDFFSRLVDVKAKGGGNWFTDLFGKLNPEEKRIREMIRASDKMPAQCRASRETTATDSFLRWQANIVSYRELNRKEQLTGLLWKKELSPRLRSDISHFAFSKDGKYFLAQDDFAITVIQREPLQILFQIPAPESHNAAFTPDGQSVVFGSKNLRYEKWSLAEKKPVEIRELVVARDCLEHKFSPDGKYLACVDYSLGLNLLDTQTGKRIWQKKEAFELNFLEYLGWIASDNDELGFFNMEYSPDSRFFAIARSANFRFLFSFDGLAVARTEDTMLVVDLNTLKQVNVGGDLKKLARRAFLFLDSNRILAMAQKKPEDGGIFSFPEGKRLEKLTISAKTLERTANDNYIILKPLANAKLGVFDLTKKIVVSGFDRIDATLWNNIMISESMNGNVLVREVSYDEAEKRFRGKDLGTIEVPVGAIGKPQTAEISDNLQWLAVSSKTRGAVWNIGTGERKMHLRGFRGALLADSGNGIGDFPGFADVKHSLVVFTSANGAASALREIPEKGARQYRRFLLTRLSLKSPDKQEKEADKKPSAGEESEDQKSLTRDVRFELFDLINNKAVWTADFPKVAPRYFFDEFAGRLILYWRLDNDQAKARLKENSVLAARAKEMGNKDDDYLVEVVDAYAGKSVGTLLLETGKGSFSIDYGFSEGDWLVLRDDENRVLAYSIKDGSLRHRFFGSYAAINPVKAQIVVENYPGELTFYDLTSGDTQTHLALPGSTAFLRFALDGKKLFVLNSEQTAYLFDVEKLAAKPVAAVQ